MRLKAGHSTELPDDGALEDAFERSFLGVGEVFVGFFLFGALFGEEGF